MHGSGGGGLMMEERQKKAERKDRDMKHMKGAKKCLNVFVLIFASFLNLW